MKQTKEVKAILKQIADRIKCHNNIMATVPIDTMAGEEAFDCSARQQQELVDLMNWIIKTKPKKK